MRTLLKNILLAHEPSPRPVSILVDEDRGEIVSIGQEDVEAINNQYFTERQAYASPGWLDLCAFCGEPGDERSQTLESLADEASKGGYGRVLLHPHHAGQFDSELEIQAISSIKEKVAFSVAAPLSEGLKGTKLRELMHFAQAGAAAFSDGYRHEGDSAFYNQALQYGRNLAQPIFIRPDVAIISQAGQVYEGNVSAITGLPAVLPNLEEIAVNQYIRIAQATGVRIHFSCLTDPLAVQAVIESMQNGLPLSYDVSAVHLVHNETEYEQFDSAYKIYPFLRSEDKVKALRALVKKHLPAISSNHRPTTPEAKDTDFTHSEFGARTLETSSWSVISACKLTAFETYQCLHAAPARILGLEAGVLKPGTFSSLNVFSLDTLDRPIIEPNKGIASPLIFRL